MPHAGLLDCLTPSGQIPGDQPDEEINGNVGGHPVMEREQSDERTKLAAQISRKVDATQT